MNFEKEMLNTLYPQSIVLFSYSVPSWVFRSHQKIKKRKKKESIFPKPEKESVVSL